MFHVRDGRAMVKTAGLTAGNPPLASRVHDDPRLHFRVLSSRRGPVVALAFGHCGRARLAMA